MDCKICNSHSPEFHKGKILMKYDVSYYQCEKCKFIQTEKPYWLNEAYSSAITHLDIGLLDRNIYLIKNIPNIIDTLFPTSNLFLDYGGGYGVFVRLMRDLGFDFYRYDIFCENTFAKHFDFSDSKANKFDIVTSFEVFEHLEAPLEEIKKMFFFADTLIFSTQLIPKNTNEFTNWWYVSPETGQHIAFYHQNTFLEICKLFNCHYYSNGHNLHILTKQKLDNELVVNVFHPKEDNFINKLFPKKEQKKRESLITRDLKMIKELIYSGKI